MHKNVPLKGFCWGARDTPLRNSSILRSPPRWGITLLLLGKGNPCWGRTSFAPNPLGKLLGIRTTNTLWGYNSLRLAGDINPDSALGNPHRYLTTSLGKCSQILCWETATSRPGNWGSIDLTPAGDNHPNPARENECYSAGDNPCNPLVG